MKKKVDFELASQEKVIQYSDFVNIILENLGHPEALVTDESKISDFLNIFDKDNRGKEFEEFLKKMESWVINVNKNDYICYVAEKMKKSA